MLPNFSVLTSVTKENAGAETRCQGTINSLPNTGFRIECFANVAGDPSGFGEGQNDIGFIVVATDNTGFATFNLLENTQPGTVFTATATRLDSPNQPVETSEFSRDFVIQQTGQADVSVQKNGPGDVAVGQNLTYTIVVANVGQSAATSVVLSDVIPANTTFVGATQVSGPTFTLIAPTTTPPTFQATIATLAANGSATFRLVVHVNSTAIVGDFVENTATVTATNDSNETNNSDITSADIEEAPPVSPLVCTVATSNEVGNPGTATLADDADNPGDGVLIVTGTGGNDVIVVEPRPVNSAQLRVKLNGRLLGIVDRASVQHIVIFGLAGNDTLVVNATLTQTATLFGSEGNDNLFSGRGADSLDGGSGNDRLFGDAGDDTLCGGDGNDFVYGQGGNDTLGGDAGNDRLGGEGGNDLLLGGDGNDQLFGGVGNDRLFGQAGNDRLFGENGNDILVGGGGNDQLFGGIGRDVLIGGDGADLLIGEAHDDILIAGSTTLDEDQDSLAAILAEWTSANSYAARVSNLRSGGGANGSVTLDSSTILDDGRVDTLIGNGGLDWFLDGKGDRIKDRTIGELVN